MSCCAAGTESASELEALKTEGPSADELWLASRPLGNGMRQCDLIVPGVHCGVCIGLIERELPKLAGIDHARVNLSSRRVAVVFSELADGARTDLGAIASRLKALGYPAHLPGLSEAAGDPALRELLKALAVAGFAAMNVMLLSVSVWSGAESATRDLFHLISALIAAPALIYSGRVFFVSAWTAVRHGRTNMDVPISLGVILAYAMSFYETLTHGESAYFDASLTLLFFLLAGRTLDHVMRERARSAVRNLAMLSPRGAMVLGDAGRRDYRSLDELQPGMRIALAAGERVPVDGRVVEGRSDMDFAVVNGESAPVTVEPGSMVPAGTLNLTGSLVLEATNAARDSFLSEMVTMMEAAESGRAGYRRIADRASAIYAPVVHLMALATFIGWMAVSGDWRQAMLTAVAVLIITCPCALGLAVPVVQVVAAGRLFENGIMVKDGTAMERLAEADHVVFDKTGTLTRGLPRLVDAERIAPEWLRLAGRIGAHSRHPLSHALALLAEETSSAGDTAGEELSVRELAGEGLEATAADGSIYRLGHASFALQGDGASPADDEGSEAVLSRDGRLLARFHFADELRRGAEPAIAELSALGLDAEILSGDREQAVAGLARELGLGTFAAGIRPAGKVARLTELAAAGRRTLMVGDGLNDAPALAAAHVSMAPAGAADVGRQAADFVFLHQSLEAVPLAISVSRQAGKLIRQNFALAILYNCIAVPAAVLGHATPLVAAVAMSSSSILVVLNSLRLRRKGAVRGLAEARRPVGSTAQAAQLSGATPVSVGARV
ncbi:Cu2+-exporting ATPase [Hoeflea marina]|uniref:Cu2+-exporting ATPase n=1 Tax=Hoeflea marina TaxID=274592 RepID=A0A317PEI2_9HYPH|nr:heavy metal translocating P-type ATPase [Hoeflea marina]PWV95360.1 Cu2+-exporting ATPase [Hoeflea marina]